MNINRLAGSQSDPVSIFGSSAFSGDAYNEAFSTPSLPRDHWKPVMAAFDSVGGDLLKQRQDRVKRTRHADGVTFNLFDDAGSRETPWALGMIPLPITSSDWATLESGIIQRAILMERILADLYGPQDLLKNGQLPPELVFANPNFLHQCHGIHPAGDRHLAFFAADIYRGADGRFRVLRDHGANPAGLGYALENRIVISRVFSDLYHQTQIQRLAPFFQAFHRCLTRWSSKRREDPGVVILSPGPESHIYFEHALLSRYLGYPLAESQDLTVRNGQVFLKKLAGLEPVEVVFRQTADDGSDPFVVRGKASAGVAGLIQASRERTVDIVNPLGSGFIETPALSVFLPALCRHLMGEDLLLEDHPAWWCGNGQGRDHVLANLAQLHLAPAMDRSLTADPQTDPVQAVQMMPYAFMARSPVLPAMAPTWTEKGVHPRPTLMRVFACATDRGFTVMPGGLAITADDVKTLLSEGLERQRSKDIWVFSDHPVAPVSLMSGLQTAATVSRSSDLPSRVADHLMWLGRYLERAEAMVRLLRSIFRRISGEARLDDIPDLAFLLRLLQAKNTLPQASKKDGALPRYRELTVWLNDALYRQDRPESVAAVIKQVRMAARNVRDRLSLDSWHAINRLDDFADAATEDPLELLDDTLFTLSAFSGLAMESMTRGLGWRFMDMGRRMERAITLSGLIRIGLPQVCTEARSALEALLEVADSIMTYRARYRTTFQLAPALDLLLVDESNPKSLVFQCSRLAAHVEQLPRQSDRRFASSEERMSLEMLTAVRLLDLSNLDCSSGAKNEALSTFLESMETRLLGFARQISAHYLSRVSATPHFAAIVGVQTP